MGKGSGSGSGSGYYIRGGHAVPPAHHSEASVASYLSYNTSAERRIDHSVAAASSSSRSWRPRGLVNVGNTCYANAALQCLLSTALTHALLDPKASAIFRRYSSNPNILEQGSGSVDSMEGSTGNGNNQERMSARERRRKERDDRRMQENCQWLTRELKALTLEYHDDNDPYESVRRTSSTITEWLNPPQHVVVDPGSITRHPDRLSKCLRPYQQEDAHEFLRAMLSTLVMNGQNKQLSSLFDGLLESAVTCMHCRRPSLTRDRYMDLSLDICRDDIETLTDALDEFTQTETLTGDNKVFCQKCETKRTATKELRLATAPSILVCHLKRFAFDKYGRLVRLHTHVKFPLRLEISNYMSRVNKARPPSYELVAVLVHQGQTCESGHYVAFVKNNGRWYMCNDSEVQRVDVATVLRQQAYILVYEVEFMRSKNGYAAPGGASVNKPWRADPQSPFMDRWRDLLSTTKLCGMDDMFLTDICSYSYFCGNAEDRGSTSTVTKRRRRRRRTRDSDGSMDAHDDLSTLGESTVESGDTSRVPFRRSSSSGNIREHYRSSSGSRSTGRARPYQYSDPGRDRLAYVQTWKNASEAMARPKRGDLPPRYKRSERHRRASSSAELRNMDEEEI